MACKHQNTLVSLPRILFSPWKHTAAKHRQDTCTSAQSFRGDRAGNQECPIRFRQHPLPLCYELPGTKVTVSPVHLCTVLVNMATSSSPPSQLKFSFSGGSHQSLVKNPLSPLVLACSTMSPAFHVCQSASNTASMRVKTVTTCRSCGSLSQFLYTRSPGEELISLGAVSSFPAVLSPPLLASPAF